VEEAVWLTVLTLTDPDVKFNASGSVQCIFRSQIRKCSTKRYYPLELKYASSAGFKVDSMIGRVCLPQIWGKEIMFHYLIC
jgi:hypothetical protein